MSPNFFYSNYRLVVLSAAVSLILSLWCVWADPVVNNDGVYYFRLAGEIYEGDWSSVTSLYVWPFYPMLISFVSAVTGLNIELSAHLLNAMLYVLLVIAFIAVIHELGGNRRTLLIASLIILSLPTLNKYRPYIIRDAGFLAFYMWSMLFLFRYWKTSSRASIVAWVACLLSAFLFRVEAAAFLVGTPILLASKTGLLTRSKWLLSLIIFVIAAILFSALVSWGFRHEAFLDAKDTTDSAVQGVLHAWDRIGEGIDKKIELLRDDFLQYSSKRYAWLVYVSSMIVVALAELVRGMSVVYALIVGYGMVKKVTFPTNRVYGLWLGVIGINVLVVIGFEIVMGFVVRRYMMALILTLMLLAPFILSSLYEDWRSKTNIVNPRWLFPATMALCAVVTIKGLDVFTDKHYLRDAGHWISANTPAESNLHSNNLILIYYSGKNAYRNDANYDWSRTTALFEDRSWRKYDYFAINISRKHPEKERWLRQRLLREPMKRFRSRKGDQVLIFKTNDLS